MVVIVQKREKLNHRRCPWFLDSIKHSFMGHVGIGIIGEFVFNKGPDVCCESLSLLVVIVILVFFIFLSSEVLPEGFIRCISKDVGDIIKELGSVPFEGLGCFVVLFWDIGAKNRNHRHGTSGQHEGHEIGDQDMGLGTGIRDMPPKEEKKCKNMFQTQKI